MSAKESLIALNHSMQKMNEHRVFELHQDYVKNSHYLQGRKEGSKEGGLKTFEQYNVEVSNVQITIEDYLAYCIGFAYMRASNDHFTSFIANTSTWPIEAQILYDHQQTLFSLDE